MVGNIAVVILFILIIIYLTSQKREKLSKADEAAQQIVALEDLAVASALQAKSFEQQTKNTSNAEASQNYANSAIEAANNAVKIYNDAITLYPLTSRNSYARQLADFSISNLLATVNAAKASAQLAINYTKQLASPTLHSS